MPDLYSNELIDYAKAQFDRYACDFDVLDNKALGIIGIAGLLVGFQVLNTETTTELVKCFFADGCVCLPFLALLSLMVHGVCLILCMVKALFAIQVKDFDYPGEVNEIIKGSESEEEVSRKIIEAYSKAAISIDKCNRQKASNLKLAVKSITISILALIAYLAFMVFFYCNR